MHGPTLSQSVGDPLNAVLSGSVLSLLIHPQNVVWVVTIQ